MRVLATVFSLILLLSSGLRANPVEPTHVWFDPADQHTTTIASIPKSISPEQFEALKQGVSQRKGSYILSWEEFNSDPEKHIRKHIRRNDYPDVDTVQGFVKLLTKFPGNPFGLTWNGGIAITQNDFGHSARTYMMFINPRNDPVHPNNHLGPLLRQ